MKARYKQSGELIHSLEDRIGFETMNNLSIKKQYGIFFVHKNNLKISNSVQATCTASANPAPALVWKNGKFDMNSTYVSNRFLSTISVSETFISSELTLDENLFACETKEITWEIDRLNQSSTSADLYFERNGLNESKQ